MMKIRDGRNSSAKSTVVGKTRTTWPTNLCRIYHSLGILKTIKFRSRLYSIDDMSHEVKEKFVPSVCVMTSLRDGSSLKTFSQKQ